MVTRFSAVVGAAVLVGVWLGPPLTGQSTATHNQLTAEEKHAGWKLLFDGHSLAGWRGYKRPDATGSRWKVEDGFLTLPANDGKDTAGRRDIIYQGHVRAVRADRGNGRSRRAATAA